MKFGKKIICSILILMFVLGLETYIYPESVQADAHPSFIQCGISKAAVKRNNPSITGDEESVLISFGEKPTLIDNIRYSNLTVGKTYTIEGKLYELAADEKGAKTTIETGISNTQTFVVPDSPRAKATEDGENKINSGVISQLFSVEDLEKMRGKDYVIFETLKNEDDIIAKLDSTKDSSRYVRIPSFTASVMDPENGTRISLAGLCTSAKYAISYENLIPGKNYYSHVRLIKQGEADTVFTLAEDNSIFVPAKTNGTLEKTIKYDVLPKSGDTVQLVYDITADDENQESNSEVLLYRMDDKTIEENRLYLSEFSIALNDLKTLKAISEYSKTATTRVNLSYSNLPYRELTIVTSLYDASTKKIVNGSNGKPCKKTEKFYAVIRNAAYSTDFTFDSTALAGHQLYVGIKVLDGNKVIYNADSKTADNRMYIASVGSKTLSVFSGAHKASLIGAAESLKDLVSYRNLLSGNKYSVESVLVNAKTKKQINTPTKSEFTAANSSGEFTNVLKALAYGGLYGTTIHSHTKLYMNDVLVASSNNVPKSYSGVYIPKPTATPKPTKAPTPKPASKPAATNKKKSTRKKSTKRSYAVYWTEYGECYHRKLSCIRRSKNIYYGSVSTAISNGLRPCKKCC